MGNSARRLPAILLIALAGLHLSVVPGRAFVTVEQQYFSVWGMGSNIVGTCGVDWTTLSQSGSPGARTALAATFQFLGGGPDIVDGTWSGVTDTVDVIDEATLTSWVTGTCGLTDVTVVQRDTGDGTWTGPSEVFIEFTGRETSGTLYRWIMSMRDITSNDTILLSVTKTVADAIAPTITSIDGPAGISGTDPFVVTFNFSEAIADGSFDAGDIGVANGAASDVQKVADDVYTALITPTGGGDVVVSVAANTFEDLEGNENVVGAEATIGSQIVETTSQVISRFMANRASGIVGNGPDLIGQLNRGQGGGGDGVFGLALNGEAENMTLAFSTSLSAIERHRENALKERIGDVGRSAPDEASAGPANGDGVLPGGTFGADAPDVEPVAATSPASMPPTRRFDIWTQIYGARSSAGDARSSLWIGYFGAHYFVNDNTVIGGLVQLDRAAEDNDVLGSSADGFGWMIGPYVAGKIEGTTLSYEARAAWGQSDNSVSPLGTYSDGFDTERWLASAKVQGDFTHGVLTVTPAVQVTYFEETQKAYVDSLANSIPEQTISLGEVRFGPNFSWKMALADDMAVTPSFGVSGVWNFSTSDTIASQGHPLGAEVLRARFDVGLSTVNARGWTISASGYYDGIGVDDYEAIGGTVRLVIPLQ